jgi:hypothetical protein
MKLKRAFLFVVLMAASFGVSEGMRFGDVIRANSEKCARIRGQIVELRAGTEVCLPSEMSVEGLTTCDRGTVPRNN